MLIDDPEELLSMRRRESDVRTMRNHDIPIRIQYWGLRPDSFVSHLEVVGSSGSGLLMNVVSFSAELDSSWSSLRMMAILWFSSMICLVSDGCRATAPQFIFEELIEQVKGKIISAVELNFQSLDMVPSLRGQVSHLRPIIWMFRPKRVVDGVAPAPPRTQ